MTEDQALEVFAIQSLTHSPSRPMEWQNHARKLIEKHGREHITSKLGMTPERLDEMLGRSLLEEYDRFDKAVSEALLKNCVDFTRGEVLAILDVQLERQLWGHLVAYTALGDRGRDFLGGKRYDRIGLSVDRVRRCALAEAGVRYYTRAT